MHGVRGRGVRLRPRADVRKIDGEGGSRVARTTDLPLNRSAYSRQQPRERDAAAEWTRQWHDGLSDADGIPFREAAEQLAEGYWRLRTSDAFRGLNVRVVVLVRPSASRTVSVTVRRPPRGYTAVTTGPLAVRSGDVPRSQSHETTPWSSVDVRPSNVQVKFALHDTVKFATGG